MFKVGHQKDMCLTEIGLHVQDLLTTLSSMISIIGGGDMYDHLMSTKTLPFLMNKVFRRASKFMKQMARAQVGFANHLTQIVCLISKAQWADGP